MMVVRCGGKTIVDRSRPRLRSMTLRLRNKNFIPIPNLLGQRTSASRKTDRLADVFRLKVWISLQNVGCFQAVSDHIHDCCHWNTHVPNTGHAAHSSRINGDSAKLHVFSSDCSIIRRGSENALQLQSHYSAAQICSSVFGFCWCSGQLPIAICQLPHLVFQSWQFWQLWQFWQFLQL